MIHSSIDCITVLDVKMDAMEAIGFPMQVVSAPLMMGQVNWLMGWGTRASDIQIDRSI